jgi:hypothetical protein
MMQQDQVFVVGIADGSLGDEMWTNEWMVGDQVGDGRGSVRDDG